MEDFEEQEYTKDFELSLWKKIFSFGWVYKKKMIEVSVYNIIWAVAEQLYPLLSMYAIDHFITERNFSSLPWFIAGFLVILLIYSWTIYGFIDRCGFMEAHIVHDIRRQGFRRLQELSFSYYDTTHVGWIMARMTSDAQRIGDVISWGFMDITSQILNVLAAIVVMFAINWKLALVVVAIMPFMAVVSYQFQKHILKRHREARKLNSKITAAYNEGINGAKTTKTMNREARNFADFRGLSYAMKTASLKAIMLSSMHFPLIMLMSSVGVGAVLWVGGVQVMGTFVTIGTFSAFVSYAFRMLDPITQIAERISEVQSAQASAERALTLLETEPDIIDPPDIIEKYGDFMEPSPENWEPITGEIEFKDVSFKYKTGEKVLENFNLKIKAGEKLALVGETGSGKSTIVNLICRFYEPTGGAVLIDGVDYRERSQIWLQSNLGYVLQTPHLFSGTIMENIRYSYLEATDDEVIEAAKMVGAYDFIKKLEHGFETDVGEGGSKLSAGEKQLVSFARAILGRSKIFVLDEATASIDTETEREIQKAIDSVLKGKTSIIVAHRLSTIRSADRILVIEDGVIAEMGSHKELLHKKGIYYNLYTNQFKDEAESALLREGAR